MHATPPREYLQYSTVEVTERPDGRIKRQKQYHYSPLLHRNPIDKFKVQSAGCCGCCNEAIAGGGLCDLAEVSKRRSAGVKQAGPCACWNCAGCCNREKIYVRRGSSIDSYQMRECQNQLQTRVRSRKGCC